MGSVASLQILAHVLLPLSGVLKLNGALDGTGLFKIRNFRTSRSFGFYRLVRVSGTTEAN
ncbi:hypothetical protein KUL152_31020 [Tenacibaculum sp. KUL152]|nr:hypothetical protein KUL152_31020 [Tenacibaculum sp. KUL152]